MAVDFFNLHKPLSLKDFHHILAIKATFPKGSDPKDLQVASFFSTKKDASAFA